MFAIALPIGAYTPLLERALHSLGNQGVAVQVSLLDASGDQRTRDIADRFADLFTYRRHGPDEGQAAAIAEGWQHLDAPILCWLNADDFFYPDALDKVARIFAADVGADLVFGHSAFYSAFGDFIGYHPAVTRCTHDLKRSNTISQPSCFVRRTAVERAGGIDPALTYTMDWDLWVRLLDAGVQFRFIDEVLSGVSVSTETKTGRLRSRRYREIASIVARSCGISRMFSTLAFTLLHHLLFYGRFGPSLRRRIQRRILAGVAHRECFPAESEIRGLVRSWNVVVRTCTLELAPLLSSESDRILVGISQRRTRVAPTLELLEPTETDITAEPVPDPSGRQGSELWAFPVRTPPSEAVRAVLSCGEPFVLDFARLEAL